MKQVAICVGLVALLTTASCGAEPGRKVDERPLKVLFIGNSYTSFNDLPGLVAALADAGGQKIEVGRHTRGGCTFERHVMKEGALKKIAAEPWDVVVLQEQSMRPVADVKKMHQYARTLHALVVWLGISDGNMQEGSFRCDANVSVRKPGAPYGTRREVKNLNSFKFLQQAIDYEVQWQIELLEDAGQVLQATVLFDPDSGETRAMRTKEDAHDYRYFPDPDLPPLQISQDWIERVRSVMPEW